MNNDSFHKEHRNICKILSTSWIPLIRNRLNHHCRVQLVQILKLSKWTSKIHNKLKLVIVGYSNNQHQFQHIVKLLKMWYCQYGPKNIMKISHNINQIYYTQGSRNKVKVRFRVI